MNFSLFVKMLSFCSCSHTYIYINLRGSHELTSKQETYEHCEGLQKIVQYSYIVILLI